METKKAATIALTAGFIGIAAGRMPMHEPLSRLQTEACSAETQQALATVAVDIGTRLAERSERLRRNLGAMPSTTIVVEFSVGVGPDGVVEAGDFLAFCDGRPCWTRAGMVPVLKMTEPDESSCAVGAQVVIAPDDGVIPL